MTLKTWLEELTENQEETIEIRRYLHAHPELSFEEKETADYIIEKLKSYGIEDITPNVGNGYGLVAKIKGGKPGKTIALRADFDALAITEESDVPFISQNTGVMHACGHDIHTASLLSIAKVLQNHREELHGNVVLLHQNAEEILPGGAKSMVEAGALEEVDVVFAIHVNSSLPAGMVGYADKYATAAADSFTIHIQGKGGHASQPSETSDSVIIASQIISNLQTMVSRQLNPLEPAVVTFASVTAGGDAYNVIADTAEIRGTVRTLDENVRQAFYEKIVHLSDVVASIQGGSTTVDYVFGYPSIKNSSEEVAVLASVLEELFGEDKVKKVPVGMGGEDFSYFLNEKPGAFFIVGGNNPEIDANYPHHHPKFKMDEQCIQQSGESFLGLVAKYLLPE